MKIEGQAALVTGGGSGLGAVTARELARHGAKVAVLDINADGAAEVAREIGGLGFACDISSAESVRNIHLNGEVIRLDGALRMAPR